MWDDPSLQGPREAMRNVRCPGNQGALGPQGGGDGGNQPKKAVQLVTVTDITKLYGIPSGYDIHSLPW